MNEHPERSSMTAVLSRTPGTTQVTGTITGMATANLTVSLDPAVIEMAKAQAGAAGMKPSAWVAKLIRDATIRESARRYAEYNRTAPDRDDMAAWDAANRAEQDARLAGAEW